VFDGVHIAHQQLIRKTILLANRLNGTAVVITFHPDPQCVLRKSSDSVAIMPLDTRLEVFAKLGVDWTIVISFTKRFSQMSASQFIERVLIDRIKANTLVVGDKFAFGKGRRGNMQTLRTEGVRHGMRVISVLPIKRGGLPVSSSRIRKLIESGDLTQARQLLGCSPMIYGTVIRGSGRGRKLVVPTANLKLNRQVLPPKGVYAVRVRIGRARGFSQGVMNYGYRPTFSGKKLVCEVHLFKSVGKLLGRKIMVKLVRRLRPERHFLNTKALRRQIARDINRARKILASNS